MEGKVTCSCGHRVNRWKNYKEQGVAEGSTDTVMFEIDSENAYNHVMKQFGSVVGWDGDTMVAPRKYWGSIQELAYSAGGEATEVGNEQGVAEEQLEETIPDAVDKVEQLEELIILAARTTNIAERVNLIGQVFEQFPYEELKTRIKFHNDNGYLTDLGQGYRIIARVLSHIH
jgi:hypothetical protein